MLVLKIDKVPRKFPTYLVPLSLKEILKGRMKENRRNFIGWGNHVGRVYGGVEVVGARRAVLALVSMVARMAFTTIGCRLWIILDIGHTLT